MASRLKCCLDGIEKMILTYDIMTSPKTVTFCLHLPTDEFDRVVTK